MKSMNKHQANLSGKIHRSLRSMHLEFLIMSAISCVSTCAWSLGGPGLNFGEHRGGNSKLGTINPCLGVSALGLQNSYIKLINISTSLHFKIIR